MKKERQVTGDKTLKALIKKAGMTQKEFAAGLNVDPSTVGFWVAGKMTPNFENACRMSLLLRVPLDELAEALNLPYYEQPNPLTSSWQFHQALMDILCDLL